VKKRSGAHEDTLRELRIRKGGLWLGEPLAEFHGVLSGTPMIMNRSGGAVDVGAG